MNNTTSGTSEAIHLANVIKNTHKKLRDKCKKGE